MGVHVRRNMHQGDTGSDDRIVARGEIAEYSLASGFRFTFSSLQVLQAYESVSSGHAPLLVLVVLDGIVELTLGSVEHVLSPGDAVSMQLRMKQHIRLRMQLRTQNEYSVYN